MASIFSLQAWRIPALVSFKLRSAPCRIVAPVLVRPSMCRSAFSGIAAENKRNCDDDEEQGEGEDFNVEALLEQEEKPVEKKPGPWRSRFPLLDSKEKKELRAHVHALGKDITVQHVGKWGITPQVTRSLSETLEANELIKLKVLENCPNRMAQIAREVEDRLEAQVVGKMGRTLVVYRASIRKFEADARRKASAKKAAATNLQPRRTSSTWSRRPYANKKAASS